MTAVFHTELTKLLKIQQQAPTRGYDLAQAHHCFMCTLKKWDHWGHLSTTFDFLIFGNYFKPFISVTVIF